MVTDNEYMARETRQLLGSVAPGESVDFRCSPRSEEAFRALSIPALDVKREASAIARTYDLILSIHCKQLFPASLVASTLCVNLHPGLNPHNRGWYPQVFSILNGKPLGATLHVMDAELDHGPVIAQKEVPLYVTDTSKEAYERVQTAELELLHTWLPKLLSGDFSAAEMEDEGNVNLRADFANLCALDLDERVTMGEALDRLRALTHGDHRNAYFLAPDGRKVFVRIALDIEPPLDAS